MFDDGAVQDPFWSERAAMVEEQLVRRGIHDPMVLRVMREVPRHLFVPEHLQAQAYDDGPLPIGLGQTISQPYMVALMLELLDLRASDRVLDIGTGSGYQAAILSRLAREVWSVEIVPELAESAGERLARLGYHRVQVVTGDGSVGLPEHAPYDAMVVAAGAPHVPAAMIEQLSDGGRLVIPVGDLETQALRLVTRTGRGTSTQSLLSCAFVPLVGRGGWPGAAAFH